MKKIEAIIQLSKLDEVQDALDGMTVCEVRGFGRQNRHKETYRCKEYTVNFLPMIKIDLIVPDQNVDEAAKLIIQSAKTDTNGDGKVLISDVKEAAYALAI